MKELDSYSKESPNYSVEMKCLNLRSKCRKWNVENEKPYICETINIC